MTTDFATSRRAFLAACACATAARGAAPPIADCIFPLERDTATSAPARGDVSMSSRWWHPRRAGDPHDTMRDLAAFHATRLEWIYDGDPVHILQVKQAGIAFCATVNATDSTPGRIHSARNFDGGFMTFPWMIAWKQGDGLPPGACCVNNQAYRKYLAEAVTKLAQSGVAGVQYDDWGSNASLVSNTSECLCDDCLRRFAAARNVDYRRHLKSERGVTNAEEYRRYRAQNAADPLQQDYVRFQHASVREWLTAVKATLAQATPAGARRPALSVNAFFDSTSQRGRPLLAGGVADYMVGECGDATLAGLFLNAKMAEALRCPSVVSPYPKEVEETRSVIAMQYALGQWCLAPYDIWMRTNDVPRHFGLPEDYADLFEFVRRNATLLEACETVATAGIAVDTGQPQDKRLRPLIQTLAEHHVPFVLLPMGRLHYEPYLSPVWRERVRAVVDLCGTPDVKKRFPNARVLSPDLTPEELRGLSVVSVEAPGVAATVRAGAKTAAIHLVNRSFKTVERFGLRLLGGDFWRGIRQVELLAPGAPPQPLATTPAGSGLRVVVPSLRTWAIMRLS